MTVRAPTRGKHSTQSRCAAASAASRSGHCPGEGARTSADRRLAAMQKKQKAARGARLAPGSLSSTHQARGVSMLAVRTVAVSVLLFLRRCYSVALHYKITDHVRPLRAAPADFAGHDDSGRVTTGAGSGSAGAHDAPVGARLLQGLCCGCSRASQAAARIPPPPKKYKNNTSLLARAPEPPPVLPVPPAPDSPGKAIRQFAAHVSTGDGPSRRSAGDENCAVVNLIGGALTPRLVRRARCFHFLFYICCCRQSGPAPHTNAPLCVPTGWGAGVFAARSAAGGPRRTPFNPDNSELFANVTRLAMSDLPPTPPSDKECAPELL